MAEAFHFLTPDYRARLRPRVNARALERFLAAMPPEVHTAAMLTFVHHLTADDLRALNRELGDEEALRELERLSQEPVLPEPPLVPSAKHDGPRGSLPFVTVPTTSYVVQLKPPTEPELQALWRPIEPGFTDRVWPDDGAV